MASRVKAAKEVSICTYLLLQLAHKHKHTLLVVKASLSAYRKSDVSVNHRVHQVCRDSSKLSRDLADVEGLVGL